MNNKELTTCFFTATLVEKTIYKCKFCDGSIKYCSGGFKNFINHIKGKHKDHEEIYKKWKQEQNGRIIEFVSDKSKKRAEEIHHWMKIVIVEDQCCSLVEKEFMRTSDFAPISVDELFPKLTEANDISIALQNSTLNLRKAKAYFTRVNTLFPALRTPVIY
jgi:hypothetical protein